MSQARVDDAVSPAATPHSRTGPPMWFSLPPGFLPLGDRLPDDLAQTLSEGLSPAAAEAVTEAVEGASTMLQAQRHSPLRFHAAGMHPREDGGHDLSQLSAGSVAVARGTAEALLLRVAESEEARAETTSVRVHDFPAGAAVVAERSVRVGGIEMRGIRASFAHPDLHHLAILDLASNATAVWESYQQVLLGILAPSLSFEDPATVAEAEQARTELSGRIGDRLGGRPGERPEPGDVPAGDRADGENHG